MPGADTPHARAARFLQAFRDAGYTGAISSLPNPGGNRQGKPARITLQESDLAELLQVAVQAQASRSEPARV